MALTDFKVTVIGAVNEVREKQKLSRVTTLDQDSDSLTKLKYLNDVVADLSDYGRWQEQYREYVVSLQASVADYAVSGIVVQAVHEVAISTRSAELRRVDLDDIRRLQRNGTRGEPTQWSIKGVNGEGNPIITTYPLADTSETTKYFKIAVFEKPNVYTTADASLTVPFPGRVVVQGLLAESILDESDGDPTSRYAANLEKYENMKREAFNRYNGDTGSTVHFRPGRGYR